METHGGSLLYHPTFVWIFGGFLSYFLIQQFAQRKWDYLKLGFPLTFSFSFILFFSLSATKLPHYTWPIWAALAIQGGLLESLTGETRKLSLLSICAIIPSTVRSIIVLVKHVSCQICCLNQTTGADYRIYVEALNPEKRKEKRLAPPAVRWHHQQAFWSTSPYFRLCWRWRNTTY